MTRLDGTSNNYQTTQLAAGGYITAVVRIKSYTICNEENRHRNLVLISYQAQVLFQSIQSSIPDVDWPKNQCTGEIDKARTKAYLCQES
jgi:hypothetical protein